MMQGHIHWGDTLRGHLRTLLTAKFINLLKITKCILAMDEFYDMLIKQ
jgi:hypothetical protein